MIDVLDCMAQSAVAVEGSAIGSGTIIAASRHNSYVLTCAHVVGHDEKFRVVYRPHLRLRHVNAALVAIDDEADLALLRTAKKVGEPLEVEKEEPALYERLYVMGSPGGPGGLFGTAADAILVGRNGSNGYPQGGYQFTGLAAPGISGGTLANYEGRLVGVVSDMMLEGHLPVWGVGFAVPLPKIIAFLDTTPLKRRK